MNRRTPNGLPYFNFVIRVQSGWGWDAGAHREYSPALDGIYVVNEKGEIVFRRVAPPSDEEVARIVKNVCHHVGRLLERRGLGPQATPEEIDTLRHSQPLLAELYGASVSGRVALGTHAGRHIVKIGDPLELGDPQPAPVGLSCGIKCRSKIPCGR